MKPTFIINRNAGTVLREGRKSFADKLKTALEGHYKAIEFVPPKKLADRLRSVPSSTQVIVGGGDGTMATAASILGKRKIPFGILPLGTMNLFAKDLGLPGDPIACAALYKEFEPRKIDIASVNGRIFLCNTMLGAGVKLAQQREEERGNETILHWFKLGHSLIKRLSSKNSFDMNFHFDGQVLKSSIKSAVIANNQYVTAPGPQNSLKKQSLSDGKLGLYMVSTAGTLQSVALLTKLALGFWQNDAAIESFDTAEVKVTNGRSHMMVLIDGELERLRTPLMFRLHPLELELLIPKTVDA